MKMEHYGKITSMLDDLCQLLSDGLMFCIQGRKKKMKENEKKISEQKEIIDKYIEKNNIDLNEYKEIYLARMYQWANIDGVNVQRKYERRK